MEVLIDYLIPELRLRLGDMDSTAYRYTDAWLHTSLILSVRSLQRWWNSRYFITLAGMVTRNPAIYFSSNEAVDGVIESRDEPIIVIMATILVLQGSLENSAWNIASWKDAEISYSNIEGGRIRNDNLKRLWDELTGYLAPPSKQLAHTTKNSLPGYKGNQYERDTEY